MGGGGEAGQVGGRRGARGGGGGGRGGRAGRWEVGAGRWEEAGRWEGFGRCGRDRCWVHVGRGEMGNMKIDQSLAGCNSLADEK